MQEFVTAAEIARHLNVTRAAVANWINRHADTPKAAGVLVSGKVRRVHVWHVGQLADWVTWHVARTLYVVQGNYGHGWEDLTASHDRNEAVTDLRAYWENNSYGGNFRLVTRRGGVQKNDDAVQRAT